MKEGAPAWMGKKNNFVQNFSKEAVTVSVLSLWHRNNLIIVQLLKSCFFGNEIQFFNIYIGVDKSFKLFVEHLESMYMNKVLNVLQTQLKTV